MNLYTGCVENRRDPMKLGRCQVRVVGVHTHDKTALPTTDLPWAYPMQPITSAAMNGIGQTPLGIVEGTWVIVMFRDDEKQQPIILGSLGGIPQKESKSVDEDEDETITIDQSEKRVEQTPRGDVVVSGSGSVVTDGNGNPWTTGNSSTATQKPEPKVVDSRPGTPPTARAKPGIDALNRGMDAMGFKGKYGRASLLAIAGGECGWVPQQEGYSYSAEALQAVFGRTFGGKPDLAQKYARWKGTRESFFDFVYAPENNGVQLGNKQPGDGGRFYGRGFIQLTGRGNYTKYARLSGVDILNNPELLNTDYDASAKVAVSYFLDRVKVSPDDPAYLEAALKAVGGLGGVGFEKKRGYYRYFIGEPVAAPEQTDKSTKPEDANQNVPIVNGVPEDRQKNLVTGFCDPNMKYPLRDYIGEPDTNRLARGNVIGTSVEFKDKQKRTGVQTGGGVTWDQPNIPYNAQYPYNKVTETESGHVMEFDDTPDNERINLFHRRGTFLEIDANGTQVNRIVGDGYSIIDRNGYILIEGAANITVKGNCNLLVQSDANIDITGDTNLNMAGKANFNVASDMSLNIGGELKVKAANIKMDSNSDFNVTASGSNKLTSGGNFEANASGQANIEGSTVHLAEGAATADTAGLGGSIGQGVKNTQTFAQLQPPPRNLEADLKYETPEENEADPEKARQFHDNRPSAPTQETPPVTPPANAPQAAKPDNTTTSQKVDCAAFIHMTSFPSSYVVHTDPTGYAWTVGTLTKNRTITPGRYGLGMGRGSKDMSVAEIICNLKGLAVNVLGPTNEMVGRIGKAWNLNSCFRNDIPQGGSATSQHLIGSAADISLGGNFGYKLMFDYAKKVAENFPYDQLLLEYRDRSDGRICWVHVSNNNYGPPKKDLRTFLDDKTHTAGKLVYLGT